MSIVVDAMRAEPAARPSHATRNLRIALLGVGHVGGALAAMVGTRPLANRFTITSGLVRDTARERPNAAHVALTSDPLTALSQQPDVVIEALGGLEPARTLLLEAIERGIPVVTANKSLLATHGAELTAAAERNGVPLRYEAAVLAGVPFLGAFNRRPLARAITSLSGIVNGTTNFILSKMSEGKTDFRSALRGAQRCGYAEPDPASDVSGADAAEKLCVLIRHFRQWDILPKQIERLGIESITSDDLDGAIAFGGAVKPLVHAEWNESGCAAFVAPAFVKNSHRLASICGVQNAVVLHKNQGELFFAGPGAGPSVTAATLLDDATEIAEEGRGIQSTRLNPVRHAGSEPPRINVKPALTGWFLRISGVALTDDAQLSSVGIAAERIVEVDGRRQWLALTHPCHREQITWALRDFVSSGAEVSALRALD